MRLDPLVWVGRSQGKHADQGDRICEIGVVCVHRRLPGLVGQVLNSGVALAKGP